MHWAASLRSQWARRTAPLAKVAVQTCRKGREGMRRGSCSVFYALGRGVHNVESSMSWEGLEVKRIVGLCARDWPEVFITPSPRGPAE